MIYSYVSNKTKPSINLMFTTVSHPPVMLSAAHPKWSVIEELRVSGELSDMSDEDVLGIISPKTELTDSDWFNGRVEINAYGATLDGKQITGAIASGLVKAIGTDVEANHVLAISRFLEKASENTSMPDADKLYRWILAEGLTLTSDGDFIGYKSVQSVPPTHIDSVFEKATYPNGDVADSSTALGDLGKDIHRASYSGGGIVNGMVFEGHVPNFVGAVVEMPRDKVDANGSVECSVGLHVGTYEFARTYSGDVMLLVKVNPRDVVSIPDHDFSKLRSCRYTVIAKGISGKIDSSLYVEEQYAPIVVDESITEEQVSQIATDIVSTLLDRIRATV